MKKGNIVRTAPVFSDNMVLQRGKQVRIFGTCEDGCGHITVTVPELELSAEAVISGGKWSAVLPPMKACERCTVIVSSDDERIVFENAAVGEVWLAGGQSNMEFELRNEKNGAQALRECSGENVRFYYTPKCEMNDEKLAESEERSSWQLPSEENSAAWSAVGYYFARELSRKLGVTVGIIGCNWGGTSASAWVDRETLTHDDRLRPYLDEYDKACEGKTAEQMIAEYDEYTVYQAEFDRKMAKCYEAEPDITWDEVQRRCGENRYPGPMGIKNPMRPCGLYEIMVSRVSPYTLAGFLYYQGESDDHRPQTYGVLLKALIEKWRSDWHDLQLPFLLVQLPMHRFSADPDRKNWCLIREAQMNTYRTVKNTGIAVALDCGEFNNIHPVEKERVGHRLYLSALYEVYGLAEKADALPPMFSYAERDGDGLVLHFENCCGFETDGSAEGFELSAGGEDFAPAQAEINGDTIRLMAELPEAPIQLRYLWTNYGEVHIFGRNGLPLPPFRAELC